MEELSTAPAANSQRPNLEALTGLEFVRLLAEGRLARPPMAELLPFTLMPPESGAVTLKAFPETRFLNTLRTVHGGWSMTMLDTAMALAAHSVLEPAQMCPTHETSVKFVRPILADSGELTIVGKVISRSRTVITLDGRIESADGKLHAHGTSTCLVQGMKA
jgi:uncharacterized protein (TIGR00369 family)